MVSLQEVSGAPPPFEAEYARLMTEESLSAFKKTEDEN
jgi:hypothetical protein